MLELRDGAGRGCFIDEFGFEVFKFSFQQVILVEAIGNIAEASGYPAVLNRIETCAALGDPQFSGPPLQALATAAQRLVDRLG